ncbi:conserved protein of unknown function [Rhodovastum atsumiense]|uniref:Uncharacterized protein n=1 Tax=Rhodovastum atsumiense TaxID=504468 RepID=A0A5M6IT28_9PROT|nr:hypothetical protein [Rhodovastum atsumiense]KAA5611470.1 hypothetical protein F1189_14150 [Rhodovastum atsumiense]CAH2601158.1 conserved protein of unknown function [Rhodovastum atsumiense]
MASSPSYAVLFKAFSYDRFVRRRLAALRERVGHGHVHLMIDETHGRVGRVDHPMVLRHTESDMTARGYAGYPAGRLFWYNADYPLYFALEAGLEYDYYVMLEYDAVANCDLDAFVAAAAATGADFIGEPMARSAAEWMWLASCRDAFPSPMAVHPYLVCVCLFSRAAALHLRTRRLDLSARHRAGEIRQWPISEGFMSTEMIHAGFTVRSLSDYGRIPHVAWWPPYHEAMLGRLSEDAFVHPVLSGSRYVRSLFRNGLRPGLTAQWQALFSRLPPRPIDLTADTVHRQLTRS